MNDSTTVKIVASDRVTWEFTGEQELRDGIEWLENDAAYLERCAKEYREKGSSESLADKLAHNAANSRRLAGMLKTALAS